MTPDYSFTKHRILQWMGILLALGIIAVSYWYFGARAGTTVNKNLGDSLSQGLAGYWKLDEGSGTSATDSSTNGNTGTLTNGPTWTTGQIGGAVSFDGSNDYITVAPTAAIKPRANITLSAWVKRDASGEVDYIFWERDSAVQEEGIFFYYGSDNKLHFVFRITGTGYVDVASTTTVTDTNWHLVTVTSDASNLATFYIDGVVAGSGTTTTPNTGLSISSAIMGARNGGGAPDFYGDLTLDEIRFYTRTLSSDEVSQLYRLTSPTGVDTNLKGYWTFDGRDISGTTALDRSGAGNNGTLTNGPSITEGKVGQSLDFDGTNDYVTTADYSFSNAQAFTMSVWFKADTVSGNQVIFSKTTYEYNLRLTNSTLEFTYWDTGALGEIDLSYSGVAANRWYLASVVFNGAGTAYLYIDGVRVSSDTSIVDAFQNKAELLLIGGGYHISGNTGYLNGKIDEVRIYNTALSVNQIKALYNQSQADETNTGKSQPQGTGRLDSGLAGYWKLDDGSGTNATDSSTNGNTGTLTNSPTWTTGQIGGAVDFDGTNYVELGSAIKINNSDRGTLAGWIKGDSFSLGDRIIFNYGGGAAANAGRLLLQVELTTNKLSLVQGSDGQTQDIVKSATTINTGTWYHVAAVSNGTTYELYINGQKESLTVSSGSNSGDWFADTTASGTVNSFVGGKRFNGTTSGSWDGIIDDFRIYDRPLSSDEVGQLYRLTTPTGVDTSLKGYWSFNGKDISGTTAYDRSGAGNTGTLTNGPAVTPGKVGQALSFDGTNDYVTVASSASLQLTSQLTLSVLVKPNSVTSGSILTKGSDNNNYNYNLRFVSGKIQYGWRHNQGCCGGDAYFESSPTYAAGNWYHIVITHVSGATPKLYVNGVEVTGSMVSGLGTYPLVSYSSAFEVGRFGTSNDYFSGSIDEVRIYNAALTAAQIKAFYDQGQADETNTGKSQPQGTGNLDSGLAGYWKLDDGSGTSATDSSTNANTGTLTNGPTWTTGQIGGAVGFDGVNDYIDTDNGSALDNLQELTYAVWIYPTSNSGYILAKRNNGGGEDGFRLTSGNLQGWFSNFSADSAGRSTSSTSVTLSAWSHVAMTYSHSGDKKPRLYINGAEVAYSEQDTNSNGADTDASYDFYVGTSQLFATPFAGSIDDVRIYNRAISADEVAQLYRLTSPTGVDTSLKGYWSFNGKDISGTTAYDRSGAGNNGTLTNGPTVTPGKLGQALSFDGSNDYVLASNTTTAYQYANATFTVTGWFRTTGTGSMYIVAQGACDGGWGVSMPAGTGTIRMRVKSAGSCGGDAAALSSNSTTLNDGNWHHFATVVTTDTVTSGNNTITLYIDGVLDQGTISRNGSGYGVVAQNLRIGYTEGGGGYFNGSIDEVRIYNAALTAAQVQSLYNQGR